MGGLETTSIDERLLSATTYAEQAVVLRLLKNEIVGHKQKKEAWVASGALEPVVKILASCLPAGKHNGKDTRFQAVSLTTVEEESVKLLAIQVLSTFANGKPVPSPSHHRHAASVNPRS